MKITKEFTIKSNALPDRPRSKKLKVIITIRDATTSAEFFIISIDGDKKERIECNTLEYAIDRYNGIKL